jgi:hypothetical protein
MNSLSFISSPSKTQQRQECVLSLPIFDWNRQPQPIFMCKNCFIVIIFQRNSSFKLFEVIIHY